MKAKHEQEQLVKGRAVNLILNNITFLNDGAML